jgi:anti-anti-sigma factor
MSQPTLALGGRLTAEGTAELAELAAVVVPTTPGERLVIDLSAIDAIDGVGLDALVALAARCERSGVELHLAAPNRAVRTVFEIARLHRRIAIDDTVGQPPVPPAGPR